MTSSNRATVSYEELKAFLAAYVELFIPKLGKPQDHPIAFLEEMERKSLSAARRSLDMALGDIVEMTIEWPADKVRAADSALLNQGCLPLSVIRQLYLRKYKSILKRGRINGEAEYFLARNILEIGVFQDASEQDRVQAMISVYESRLGK